MPGGHLYSSGLAATISDKGGGGLGGQKRPFHLAIHLAICTPSEKRPTVRLGEKSECALPREERPEEGREPARVLAVILLP